jgi:hypothetical protein
MEESLAEKYFFELEANLILRIVNIKEILKSIFLLLYSSIFIFSLSHNVAGLKLPTE